LAPLAFPIFGKQWARWANQMALEIQIKRAIEKLGFHRWMTWSFLPSAEWVVDRMRPEFSLYHCVDEFSAFSDAPSKEIAETEAKLIRSADLVIVSSERLAQSKQNLNPKTILVRHGVDYAHFAKALDNSTIVPDDIQHLPKPIFGFFGLIADWVDLELIKKVANSFPNASVVLLGKIRTNVELCRNLTNVYFVGPRPYAQLPAYAKAFDIALLPFRCNELTLNSNPLKAREYLAAGLPVVSTAIPEVEKIGWCQVAKDHNQFIELLRAQLESPESKAARSTAMATESWEARVQEIRSSIERETTFARLGA
jgi:glycosyltransferase involved in cell wall biosynthesis